MMAISSGCGLCPWSCSGKVGAYAIATKVALIGSGCSVAAEPTAEVSQFYNITQAIA